MLTKGALWKAGEKRRLIRKCDKIMEIKGLTSFVEQLWIMQDSKFGVKQKFHSVFCIRTPSQQTSLSLLCKIKSEFKWIFRFDGHFSLGNLPKFLWSEFSNIFSGVWFRIDWFVLFQFVWKRVRKTKEIFAQRLQCAQKSMNLIGETNNLRCAIIINWLWKIPLMKFRQSQKISIIRQKFPIRWSQLSRPTTTARWTMATSRGTLTRHHKSNLLQSPNPFKSCAIPKVKTLKLAITNKRQHPGKFVDTFRL